MQNFKRYGILTLLMATAVIAVALTVIVQPIIKRDQEVASLYKQDVYIVKVARVPSWLPRLVVLEKLFEVPVQAQVLLQPVDGTTVKLLGRKMSFAEAKNELAELRQTLQTRLSLDRFILVEGGTFPTEAVFQIFMLCDALDTVTTPCGITNFSHVLNPVPHP